MTLAASRDRFLSRFAMALVLASAALLAACGSLSAAPPAKPPLSPTSMAAIGLYELRVYATSDGKIDALNDRVRDHEIPLFIKHGMTPIGFFTPAVRPGQAADNRLFYILGYKDKAARDAAWISFAKDPEWAAAYKASNGNGALTTSISTTLYAAAEYAPAFQLRQEKAARLFELRTYHAAPGKLERLHAQFRDHNLAMFARHGMANLAYWRPLAGQAGMEDKMTCLLAFPSTAARDAAWTGLARDAEAARAAAEGGVLLVAQGGVVSVELAPTSYSPLR